VAALQNRHVQSHQYDWDRLLACGHLCRYVGNVTCAQRHGISLPRKKPRTEPQRTGKDEDVTRDSEQTAPGRSATMSRFRSVGPTWLRERALCHTEGPRSMKKKEERRGTGFDQDNTYRVTSWNTNISTMEKVLSQIPDKKARSFCAHGNTPSSSDLCSNSMARVHLPMLSLFLRPEATHIEKPTTRRTARSGC